MLDKTENKQANVGQIVLKMLEALGRRGPDSAGVAVYNHELDSDMVLRIKLGEVTKSAPSSILEHFAESSRGVMERVEKLGNIGETSATSEYLRLVVNCDGVPDELERIIEAGDDEIEVVSMGNHLEIVKQVGSPENLEPYTLFRSLWAATASGIRVCQPSRVLILSHSQPF